MDHLLTQANSFIEPLTRLPLVATLLAELLPNMDLKEVPKTRWELFNTLLLSGLLCRDLPDGDAEVVTNDFRQLPAERQEALLLLSDLALDGLLQKPPKLVFRFADIVEKGKGQSKAVREQLLEVAKSVMVSFCEMDELQEVTYYHFLHLSFQEFLAAMPLRYPPDSNIKMHGVSRLAYSAKTVTIGERFENFWLFALGFFKTDPVTFFKTLFSNVNIDMRTVNERQQAMQNMLFMMLQEMIPNVNDSISEEYRFALESIAVYLDRKVANVNSAADTPYSTKLSIELNIQALCHALRILPGLVTVEWLTGRRNTRDILDALQNQHDLQTLRIFPEWYVVEEYLQYKYREEVKSLTSLLQMTSLVNLKAELIHSRELQTLAEGLTRMNHSLKHLNLWGIPGHIQEHPLALEAFFSALAKRHKSLVCLEISLMTSYNYSTIQPFVEFIDTSKHLERLVVGQCLMSNEAFEEFLSAIQRSMSLTSLKVVLIEVRPFTLWTTQEQRNKHRERVQQLSRVAIHHTNITRLEIVHSDLDDVDAMNIVEEVLKTKGEPHQLRQLSLFWSRGITVEGVERLRQVVQENQLNLTIAVDDQQFHKRTYQYAAPIVDSLPVWSVLKSLQN